MGERCIIVGAGHAGSQAAISLRQEGFAGEILLIDETLDLPYHKPPLSKSYLASSDESSLVLRPETSYRDHAIALRLGKHVKALRVHKKRLVLTDGSELEWTYLILATGARARIPDVPGVDLEGAVTLRSLADARHIRAKMPRVSNLVILGGGFIGLEMAHSGLALGKSTQLIEAAPRILSRSVAPLVSTHIEQRSRAAGLTLFTNTRLRRLEGEKGRVTSVVTADGRRFHADMVIFGIGAAPNTELAADAGLRIDNGILVDSLLQSSEPHIYAIGDCANYEHPQLKRRVRLESVHNATSQAKRVARSIVGRKEAAAEVAWFWSDQGDMKLQTAGLSFDPDQYIVAGQPEENHFSVYHFQGERLLAVDSINRPSDHMIARQLLATEVSPSAADIRAGPQHLKQLVLEKTKLPA